MDQPTAACVCQDNYKTPAKYWTKIRNTDAIDQNLVVIKDGIIFEGLYPLYMDINHEYFDYEEANKYNKAYHRSPIFDYANDEVCSCATGKIDSVYGESDFRTKQMIETNLTGYDICTQNIEDYECDYFMRQNDIFDLFIENKAQDGCTLCYGVGKNLWPLTKDQLIDTLTNQGDCIPKQGYHKSQKGEIYRCEAGNDKKGVMAFTEADGQTDYQCGLGTYSTAEYLMNNYDHYYDISPIIMVSFRLGNM